MQIPDDSAHLALRLDHYYAQVHAIILNRQHPISGLLPASTAVNAHGDYTDAWVRDNVYSILAVWGLALAYRKLDHDRGRTYELEHSVIKLMRGLLSAMMRQAAKVEQFKANQEPLAALHAKYDTGTGATVVGDDEWGHLQLDATSVFLLMLAQMTQSGLAIVYTIEEVNFIQNLVYYIGRTYRTPDYGIWERGNKINHGNPELNASSVGLAKAALETLNGLNLFGVRGAQASVIHVLPDEIARCRATLESLLPRESSSKEVDAALLSVIGFPAFAVEDPQLVDRTRDKIIQLLQGRYGCKRFLRDGHQAVIEDTTRLHYEPWELKQFEDIECEWPLFFTYLALDALFRDDHAQAQNYLDQLAQLTVCQDSLALLPELYAVPEAAIAAEKADPHSQPRQPNLNVPLVWAQSLYLLAQMLQEKLIRIGDLDPCGQHLRLGQRRKATIQIALIAENEALQERLAAHNIATQTLQQVAPIQVRHAWELAAAYTQIGRNDKLGLTGRPQRRMRSLTTARVYKICGETMVFTPSFLEPDRFYLMLDYHFLVSTIKSELAYIHRQWQHLGRPIVTLLLTQEMLELGREALLTLVQELQAGVCGEVPVQLGQLNQFVLTAGTERIDCLHDFQFAATFVAKPRVTRYYLAHAPRQTHPLSFTQEFKLEYQKDLNILLTSLRASANLYEQIELLNTLVRLRGIDFDTGIAGPDRLLTVADLLHEVYTRATQGDGSGSPYWSIVRRAAGLMGKVDVSLSDAVTDILVRQKQIAVGRAYNEASLIMQPLPHTEVLEKIRHFCREDIRDRALTQEIIIYLSLLIKAEPELFKGLLTLRVGYLILLLTTNLAAEEQVTQDEAYDRLMGLSPFEIRTRLQRILEGYGQLNQALLKQESLRVTLPNQAINWNTSEAELNLAPPPHPESSPQNWWRQRQVDGTLNRVPPDFYPKVWTLLHHCKGLVIGDKLERRNRLESELLIAEMTAGEQNFALQVEHLLNKIEAPEYHQVNVEALMELWAIADRNPDLKVEEYVVLDVLIGHAVRLAWLTNHPEHHDRYDEYKGAAWRSFYESSPYNCASYIAKALQFLTQLGQKTDISDAASEASEVVW